MPRWISLLTLCALTAIGGVSSAWAETLVAVEIHETAPPSDTEPSFEGEEEALGLDLESVLEVADVAQRASKARPMVAAASVPPVPPPR